MIRSTSLLFVFILCGCGEGFQSKSLSSFNDSYFSNSSSKSFLRPGEEVRSDCQLTSELCVYLKNPVSQTGRVVEPNDKEALGAAQNFSVSISGLDRSGKVKNSNFDVKSISGSQVSLDQLATSKGVSSESDLIPLTASAFFWLHRAHEYLKNNYESYPSLNTPITVYVDDAFNGWSFEQKSLHLNLNKRSALSGEVVLLLFGEAQIGIASQGEIYKASPGLHKVCGGDSKGCCQSSSGCSQAILRGAGDSFVDFFFKDLSGVGEFQSQSLEGQKVCEKARRPEEFVAFTFQQAYDLCPSKKGSSLALGMAYSSIWFELRKEFDPQVVERIFLKHLESLNGSDDFNSSSLKAQEAANELGQPAVSQGIKDHFSRRLK